MMSLEIEVVEASSAEVNVAAAHFTVAKLTEESIAAARKLFFELLDAGISGAEATIPDRYLYIIIKLT